MSALRRELRPYRSPRIHYLISVLTKFATDSVACSPNVRLISRKQDGFCREKRAIDELNPCGLGFETRPT